MISPKSPARICHKRMHMMHESVLHQCRRIFLRRLQWQSTSRVASTCDSQVEGAASGAAGPAGKRDAAAPQIEEAVEKAVRVATAPRVVPAGDSAHLRHPAGLALLALAGVPASLPPRQPNAGTVAAAFHAGGLPESFEILIFQGFGNCVPCFRRLLIVSATLHHQQDCTWSWLYLGWTWSILT